MKYIKLYEAYRRDPFHAKGYKEELNAEIKKYEEEAARFNKIYTDHQLAIDNIEKKWEDENNLAIDNALNTIDICVEPFCDKWDFSEDTDTFHGQDYKCYVPNTTDGTGITEITTELINDLLKANKRINLELDRDIYIGVWFDVDYIPSTYSNAVCQKHNIPLATESELGPNVGSHGDPSISISYLSKNILKIVEAMKEEYMKNPKKGLWQHQVAFLKADLVNIII